LIMKSAATQFDRVPQYLFQALSTDQVGDKNSCANYKAGGDLMTKAD